MLALPALAAAQSFSYSGSSLAFTPVNSTYFTYFSGGGLGTVTGLGDARIKFEGTSTRERGLGCGSYIQGDVTIETGARPLSGVD